MLRDFKMSESLSPKLQRTAARVDPMWHTYQQLGQMKIQSSQSFSMFWSSSRIYKAVIHRCFVQVSLLKIFYKYLRKCPLWLPQYINKTRRLLTIFAIILLCDNHIRQNSTPQVNQGRQTILYFMYSTGWM